MKFQMRKRPISPYRTTGVTTLYPPFCTKTFFLCGTPCICLFAPPLQNGAPFSSSPAGFFPLYLYFSFLEKFWTSESILDRFYSLKYPYTEIFIFSVFLTCVRKIWTDRITSDLPESFLDRFYTIKYPYTEIFIISIFLTCVRKIWNHRITSDVPESVLDRFYTLDYPYLQIFKISIFWQLQTVIVTLFDVWRLWNWFQSILRNQ